MCILILSFLKKKTSFAEPRGYVWKVIDNPIREGDDPGMFFGELFRMMDIRLNRDEKSPWPEGIVFEHVASGCRLTYRDGLLVDLSNSKIISKKPRVRNRSRGSKCKNNSKASP